LERVEGVQIGTTREAEFARARGADWVHAGVTVHEFADAAVTGGSVYSGGARLRLYPGSVAGAALRGPVAEVDRAALDCTWVGGRFFGHWLTDDCTTHLLARDHADPIGVERPLYSQEAGYCRMLGLDLRKVASVRVRSLLVFADFGQNSNKRARYKQMRAALIGGRQPSSRAGIYLRRGSSGAMRHLENEVEIEERLARRGFAIVDPSTLGAEELVHACAGAPCVVGVEGSALAHGVMTVREGGALVTLQPPWIFNNIFKDYADCLGLPYGFVVGVRSGTGFRVSADEIERTLDLFPTA
jgi:capsular polysaccharide biosynthesis protein